MHRFVRPHRPHLIWRRHVGRHVGRPISMEMRALPTSGTSKVTDSEFFISISLLTIRSNCVHNSLKICVFIDFLHCLALTDTLTDPRSIRS